MCVFRSVTNLTVVSVSLFTGSSTQLCHQALWWYYSKLYKSFIALTHPSQIIKVCSTWEQFFGLRESWCDDTRARVCMRVCVCVCVCVCVFHLLSRNAIPSSNLLYFRAVTVNDRHTQVSCGAWTTVILFKNTFSGPSTTLPSKIIFLMVFKSKTWPKEGRSCPQHYPWGSCLSSQISHELSERTIFFL